MDDILSLQPRPRRLSLLPGGQRFDVPDFVANELADGFRRAFPRNLRVPEAPEETWLRYTIQSFGMLEPDDFRVTAKQLTGWVQVGGETVGMIQMDEWTPLLGATDISFFQATDSWSQATHDFGTAVFTAWKIRRLMKIGPLVELSKVWMQPECSKWRLWAMVVRELIRRRYANRFSLLLLNSWPTGEKAEQARQVDWRGRDGWDRHRTSLGRLAQAALGVQPVPAGRGTGRPVVVLEGSECRGAAAAGAVGRASLLLRQLDRPALVEGMANHHRDEHFAGPAVPHPHGAPPSRTRSVGHRRRQGRVLRPHRTVCRPPHQRR